ncbi:hypothetical protein [Haloarchaeobius sp. HME9146]|uniref:hypothetical protein n=1 Tax=Haloarchaeobius sp. HME9146 TaxID=2978732 RepID=UPI0021C1AA34|nr:hypothetical protein [Haloarchaeobius sp. HME9146]MCT9097444.1 hypothetical protein [Haloarchaeobius sp. HME9146]
MELSPLYGGLSFVRESVLVRWVVLPLVVLGAALFPVGLTMSRLSGSQVAEVVLYFMLLSGGVMCVGLFAEYLLKRLLSSDQEREYY